MTATDELRRLLDERGVEWTVPDESWNQDSITYWKVGSIKWVAFESENDTLWLNCNSVTDLTPAQAIAATLGAPVTGETSDGYHTFDELYHHRAVLFSVVVRDHAELAWKSKRHHDGTMYDGMFIVGIETPTGQATYHYAIDPYWEMFDCKELEQAPEWDGHTPADAIARIATLGAGTCHNIHEPPKGTTFWPAPHFKCSECGATHVSMGECFIAFKKDDGTVHTLSGMADSIHFETDREDWMDNNFVLHTVLRDGIDVTIHFTDRIVRETRPFDGREG